MRASPARPFASRVLESGGSDAAGEGSAHARYAPGHLRCGLAAPLTAGLDPHDPLAELARHFSVELDLGRIGPTTVATVPISNDGLHGGSLSRRRPATDAYQGGRNRRGDRKKRVYHAPCAASCSPLGRVLEEVAEAREDLREAGHEDGARVGAGGGGTVWSGVGGTGAGVPSIPRTRPAGVRRRGTGVVSGVGGAGSAVRLSAGWSARCFFEQDSPTAQRTTTARARPMRFIALLPSRTTFVAPSSKSMTDFGALESGLCRK